MSDVPIIDVSLTEERETPLYCAFCHESQHDVGEETVLILADDHATAICSNCIAVCNTIIAEHAKKGEEESGQ